MRLSKHEIAALVRRLRAADEAGHEMSYVADEDCEAAATALEECEALQQENQRLRDAIDEWAEFARTLTDQLRAIRDEMQAEDWSEHTTHPLSVEPVVQGWVNRLTSLIEPQRSQEQTKETATNESHC